MTGNWFYESNQGKKLQAGMPDDIFNAHKHSINHRAEIESSNACGCFACLNVFEPSKIREWIESNGDEFAMCPYCGIDAIIGNKSMYPIDQDFLGLMNKYWFDGHKLAEL